MIEVGGVRGVGDGAGREEEQALERAVTDGVEQQRDDGECLERLCPQRRSHGREPECRDDDPEILDRAVCQEALEIGIDRGVERAGECGQQTDGQDPDAPRSRNRSGQAKPTSSSP